MAIYLVYFILFAFWIENSLGFNLNLLFGLRMGFSLQNISFFFLLVGWFVAVRTQKRLFLTTNINKYIFLLLCVVIISLLPVFAGYTHSKKGIILEIVKLKQLINPWLFFFFVSHIINNKNDCRKSIWGLIVLLVMNIFASLLSNFMPSEALTQKDIKHMGRVAGFSEVNQYAAFIVLLIPQLLSSTFLQKDLPKSMMSGFFFLLSLFGLIATVSRGGYVAFVISMSVFFFLAKKKKMISIKTIAGSAFLLCAILPSIYFIIPDTTREVIDKRVFNKETAIEDFNPWERERTWINKYSSSRTSIWYDVLKEYIKKPVMGLGLNGYQEKRNTATHSDYLKYLVDHGIFGLFFYLMICFGILAHMYKAYLNSKDEYSTRLYISYLSGISGYFVAMVFVNLHDPRDIFWLYTAVMYKYTYLKYSANA